MAAPVIGAGLLTVVDRLMDASYALIQPVVMEQFPGAVSVGSQAIPISDPAVWVPTPCFYVGAYLVAGAHTANAEVIQVTAVNPGVSFTATFASTHAAGDWLFGATFPVRYPTDPLFTQDEMIAYISSATNDFLTDVPLAYNIADLTVPPTQQNTPLPADSLFPVRVAYESYPLRETSQSNLDSMAPQWSQQGLTLPRVYFRDKIPIQNVGIWPRMGNLVNLECVYAQRQAQTLGWGDGFLVPDCMTMYILYKTLSYAFSKSGEGQNPGLAKYFASRYSFGVKVCKMLIDVVNDNSI